MHNFLSETLVSNLAALGVSLKSSFMENGCLEYLDGTKELIKEGFTS